MADFIKNLINKPLSLIGYKMSRIYLEKDVLVEQEFKEIFFKYKDFTMTNLPRMYSLYQSVKYICQAKIPGDFVECGVWRGGSAMIIAHALMEMDESHRKIYLYDTYTGMAEPTEEDHTVENVSAQAHSEWENHKADEYNKWAYASLEEVKGNMKSTGYPMGNIVFIKGKVEETIPDVLPKMISLLRLDTDWYESTLHELKHLYPLLAVKGIMILDDYGYWAGSKKAVDEYFENQPILLNRIDTNGRLVVKVE